MTTRLAKLIILVVILITAGAGYQITKLTFDYEFEHFFPSDDPELEFYQSFKKKFDTDIDFVLIALKNDQGIFQGDFLKRAASLRSDLMGVKHVKRIISPFDAADYALGPFGPIAIPYLHVDQPERYARDSARIFENDKQVGSLFSEDGASISMLAVMQGNLSKVETDTVYFDMMEVMSRYEFDEIHTAGKAIGQAFYVNKIKTEFALFLLIAILLIVIVLILIYRSIWGTLVPLTVVLLSVIWLLGLMSLFGKSIDIMTTLLPLVLFVVGISDVIHLLSRYFEEIRSGLPKNDAVKLAYKRVGVATFLTSLTTSLGFLTLITSGVRPVRELGIYAAIGVFIAFILAFSLLPAILTLSRVPKLAHREPSSIMWNKLVTWIFSFTIRNKTAVLMISVVVIVFASIGTSTIEIDNYLLEDVADDDPIRESFLFFEENFSGVRPFELQFTVLDSNKSLFDQEVVAEMLEVESYLKKEYGVGFLSSPLNILRSANQALNGGLDSAYKVPTNEAKLNKATRLVKRLNKRPEFAALMTRDEQHARFSGKIHDQGGKLTHSKDQALKNHFTGEDSLKHSQIHITGMSLLIDQNNETLSQDMMTGLLFALLVVAIIMALLFRSIPLALISIVPNILPLLAIGGLMGLFDIDLKISTSVIFGIAFGIAVDDSIHYLMKYRQERLKGRSKAIALRRTSISTGKAIILTSLILCMGFVSLAFSDFTSTFYVGFLISFALAVAVMADLFLLPILIAKFSKR